MGDVALKLAQIGLEGPYTAGAASVYNGGAPVPATRRLAIEKGMGADFKFVWESPQEARGTYAGSYQHILQAITASGKIPAIVYCDDLYYYGKMAISGTPTFQTLPNAPLSLMSVADPTVQAAGTASAAGGSLATGSYTIAYQYMVAGGATKLSPVSATISVTGPTGSINTTALGALPANVTGVQWWIVTAPSGNTGPQGAVQPTGATFGLIAQPGSTTAVPSANTTSFQTQAASMNLSTQPNQAADVSTPGGSFGKILAVSLQNVINTGVALTSVTIGVTGTDIYGKSVTDNLVFSTGVTTPSATQTTVTPFSSTLYSLNYYKTVSGITCTPGTIAGNVIGVGGVNAFYYTSTIDMASSTLYSATMEYWDGSAAWQIPGIVLEKLDISMQLGKSLKLDTSFMAQKKVQLTAYSSVPGGTPGSINPVAQAGAFQALGNLKDNFANAASAYKTQVWADPIGNTPGTTAINARLTEMKINVEVGAKLGKAADGTPYPNYVGRDFYKVSGEMTMLFNSYSGATTDPSEVLQFLNGNSRTVRVALPGTTLPCGVVTGTTGWPAAIGAGNYGLMFDIAGKYEEATEKDVDGRMAYSFKFGSEVDLVTLGAQLVMYNVCRINPNAL